MSNILPTSAAVAPHADADDAIVVTGMGAIGPFGMTVEALWSALCDGRPLFVAQPDGKHDDLCGFLPQDDIATLAAEGNRGERRSVSLFAHRAANAAIAQAGLMHGGPDPTNVGIVYGTANGGTPMNFTTALEYAAQSSRFELPSLAIIDDSMGTPAGLVSHEHQFRGPILNVPMGWGAGGCALATACDLLRSRVASAVVVVAADELGGDRPMATRSVNRARRLLSPNDGGTAGVRPFDRAVNGSTMGEGGAALVLELRSDALRRGCRPIVRLSGWAIRTGVARDDVAKYDTRAIAEAMSAAIGSKSPRCVGAVFSGSHCNPSSDLAESAAVARVFGGRSAASAPGEPSGDCAAPLVTNIRGVVGDVGAVTGLYAVIGAALTINRGVLPGTTGCGMPDERHDIEIAHRTCRLDDVNAVLCNAFSSDGVYTAVLANAEPVGAF